MAIGGNKIVIDGYLTEQKLAKALKQIVGEGWGGPEVRLTGSRRRWDMWFRDDIGRDRRLRSGS